MRNNCLLHIETQEEPGLNFKGRAEFQPGLFEVAVGL